MAPGGQVVHDHLSHELPSKNVSFGDEDMLNLWSELSSKMKESIFGPMQMILTSSSESTVEEIIDYAISGCAELEIHEKGNPCSNVADILNGLTLLATCSKIEEIRFFQLFYLLEQNPQAS